MLRVVRPANAETPPQRPARRRSFSKTDLRRLIEAAEAAGINVGAVQITPDGSILVVDRMSAVSGLRQQPSNDIFEKWQDRL